MERIMDDSLIPSPSRTALTSDGGLAGLEVFDAVLKRNTFKEVEAS
jgi:hypothetical protein